MNFRAKGTSPITTVLGVVTLTTIAVAAAPGCGGSSFADLGAGPDADAGGSAEGGPSSMDGSGPTMDGGGPMVGPDAADAADAANPPPVPPPAGCDPL